MLTKARVDATSKALNALKQKKKKAESKLAREVMKQNFLAEKDKIEQKLKIKKQASLESPTKSIIIATEESDTDNKRLEHPKVLEFKLGLLTSLRLIKSKKGDLSTEDME